MTDFDTWWKTGVQNGWIDDESFCWVHDAPTLTDEEEQEIGEDGDLDAICVTVIRFYPYEKDS